MPIRFFTAGESHGPGLTAILEGMPAGLPLTAEDINLDLQRRQKGYGSGGRMQIEKDGIVITSGVMNGMTTGAPIALHVANRDFKSWKERDITPITTPRPGHADLTGAVKYGYRELRLSLERASARETTMRVAIGAICKRYLAQFGISVDGYVSQLGDVIADLSEMSIEERIARKEDNDVRCPDAAAAERMHAAIRQIKIDKDTLGGVFEVVAQGVPPGLGSHVHFDRKLDAKLVAAMVSIQAMKGAEIGSAFENAGKRGSQVHDDIIADEAGKLVPPNQSRRRPRRRHQHGRADHRARGQEADLDHAARRRIGQSGDGRSQSDGLRAQRLLRLAARRPGGRGDDGDCAGRCPAGEAGRRQHRGNETAL